jgi:N-acetyl-anhydromuramyl-L-alanine amidase AmpD
MLEIHNVENLDSKNLNITRRKSKKNQILLYDTSRRADDFISKIRYRNNEKYNQIPHFIITKLGTVYQIFDTNHHSNTFDDPQIDKHFIKIAIENLGWLNKNTITGFLNNWIGDPYRSEPHTQGWRNYYFWDKYTDMQMNSLSELCDSLCDKHNIPKKSVKSQGFFENAIKFNGVVCKSNFSNIYTDINPSFNFRQLFKDEQKQIGI